jgi:AcrR family transcriptional regulator
MNRKKTAGMAALGGKDRVTATGVAPGTAPGRRRLPPDERERLIVAEAVRFFAEVGFEGHTRDLARRLNITQPLLYRYFPSKEALIDRVYQEVYVNRWNPAWETLIEDRAQPLKQRLTSYYRDYARTILHPEWIRVFLFAGLKGGNLNARLLDMVRERIFTRVIREIRIDRGLPMPPAFPFTETEYELVWGLHASIFYIGIRKWIYGLPIPEDIDAMIDAKVTAFLEGVPRVMESLVPPAR